MVVLAIIVAITGVVFTGQSSFNKTLVLGNTAYDVALSLRNTEAFGLSSRVAGASTNVGYGLNFSKATPGVFTLFADTYPDAGVAGSCHPTNDATAPNAHPGNCSYDAGQSEKITEYKIGNSITVTDICAFSSGSWACSVTHGGTVSSLDIVFVRPNSDSFMSVNGTYSSVSPVTAACIVLSSAQGGSRFVSVSSSGQITANASSCP